MDCDRAIAGGPPRRAVGSEDVIIRFPGNPIISLADMPLRCSDIWNAGVVRFKDQVLLLITIETLQGCYNIHKAVSDDGKSFTIDAKPLLAPTEDRFARMYESVGIRDPRITPLEGQYYITAVADGDHGMRLVLGVTKDFETVERLGYISQVDVKNGMLFPGRIGGRYALLKRPGAGESIWLSYSDDLEYWGSSTAIMTPRGGYWDSDRIGAAVPPMQIDEGWLLIYYGEKGTSAGPLVRLGAAILDRDDPSRVIARSNIPILAPRERYERIGDVPNVVFSCGALLNGGNLDVYYGASDSCICRGTAKLEDVVRTCFESEREF
ncbi:MAG: glycoside hydrolase family 130 protein [Planctomycetes bacterium]|nr:glycoside hydrolase family 130 protein [Planctomycetota bacterium]